MGCAGVVVWLVCCVCADVRAGDGIGWVVWMGRCAWGRCWCVYMFPATMPWVWGGVLWFVVWVWGVLLLCEARCVASVGGCVEVG